MLITRAAIFTSVPKCRNGTISATRRHTATDTTQISDAAAPTSGTSASGFLAISRISIGEELEEHGKCENEGIFTEFDNADHASDSQNGSQIDQTPNEAGSDTEN